MSRDVRFLEDLFPSHEHVYLSFSDVSVEAENRPKTVRAQIGDNINDEENVIRTPEHFLHNPLFST